METADIAHLAHLARITLTKEDEENITKSFPAILKYISKLVEVDTSHVDAKPYLTDAVNQWREDVVTDNIDERTRTQKAFPEQSNGALEVPAVFE
jgi:aspartyl-tRNA(Asn)/glutamyl-tRNA(Gln) amidotransferase subunit C